jgi:hypothetical protein
MIYRLSRALALVLVLIPAAAFAAASPHPIPIPTPRLPNAALHTEFNVEVNKKGQVVRVKSGKSCKDTTFNAQTYGNVLQMWIRKPDGTAVVGMYRVSYDYDPHTRVVRRNVALLRAGGNWGNDQGAANQMMDVAAREAAAAAAKSGQESSKNLPDIKAIIKRDVVTPSPKPKPKSSP